MDQKGRRQLGIATEGGSVKKNWGRHEGVVVFLRRPDGKIYLAKRTAVNRPFVGLYSPPGGSIEDGEGPAVAGAREIKEETDLEIDPLRLFKLGRRGPFITPPEQQGSGTPYHMIYFAVDITETEIPKVTEPEKQGVWEARTWGDWIVAQELCPGTGEMLEILHTWEK